MTIVRKHISARMSQIVIHGNTVYLAGQVAETKFGQSVADQTQDILSQIDALLAEAQSDKSKLLSATIFLTDMSHFDEMNQVWEHWIDKSAPPVRACVEAKLAGDEFQVEICIIAAC